MENSVGILITLEGKKEEIKSLHAKTKAWASKKCLNIPSVEILDINPISEEKRTFKNMGRNLKKENPKCSNVLSKRRR